jgi:hypothetical protein
MKSLYAFLAGVALLALGACSTAQQATASADLAKLQTTVVNGCMVVQPTLMAVAAVDPTVAAAATANGLFCATAGAITVTSIQTLVSSGIPAIEKAVADSTLVPANQKPLVVAALGLFQMTVSNALAVYGNASAATPASAAPAASAPVAASN